MRVGAVTSDLIMFSRIDSAAAAVGATVVRVDAPRALPPDIDLILVDWSARSQGWARWLRTHRGRVVLFGPHTDLAAHESARRSGIGPMMARSRLLTALPQLLGAPLP